MFSFCICFAISNLNKMIRQIFQMKISKKWKVAAKEMAEHFSERIDTFNTALSRGARTGLFASPSRGLWDLKDKMEEDMRLIEYNPGNTLM